MTSIEVQKARAADCRPHCGIKHRLSSRRWLENNLPRSVCMPDKHQGPSRASTSDSPHHDGRDAAPLQIINDAISCRIISTNIRQGRTMA
jgi:hypothetical protein